MRRSCHAMAVAHYELTRMQSAEHWWKRTSELDPRFLEGYRWLAYIAMDRGRLRGSNESLRESIGHRSEVRRRPLGRVRGAGCARQPRRCAPVAGKNRSASGVHLGAGFPAARADPSGTAAIPAGPGVVRESRALHASRTAAVLRARQRIRSDWESARRPPSIGELSRN